MLLTVRWLLSTRSHGKSSRKIPFIFFICSRLLRIPSCASLVGVFTKRFSNWNFPSQIFTPFIFTIASHLLNLRNVLRSSSLCDETSWTRSNSSSQAWKIFFIFVTSCQRVRIDVYTSLWPVNQFTRFWACDSSHKNVFSLPLILFEHFTLLNSPPGSRHRNSQLSKSFLFFATISHPLGKIFQNFFHWEFEFSALARFPSASARLEKLQQLNSQHELIFTGNFAIAKPNSFRFLARRRNSLTNKLICGGNLKTFDSIRIVWVARKNTRERKSLKSFPHRENFSSSWVLQFHIVFPVELKYIKREFL